MLRHRLHLISSFYELEINVFKIIKSIPNSTVYNTYTMHDAALRKISEGVAFSCYIS